MMWRILWEFAKLFSVYCGIWGKSIVITAPEFDFMIFVWLLTLSCLMHDACLWMTDILMWWLECIKPWIIDLSNGLMTLTSSCGLLVCHLVHIPINHGAIWHACDSTQWGIICAILWPGCCFTNILRALQKNLAKIYNARNNIYAENFKLKLCTYAQSKALGPFTKFQPEIFIRST